MDNFSFLQNFMDDKFICFPRKYLLEDLLFLGPVYRVE